MTKIKVVLVVPSTTINFLNRFLSVLIMDEKVYEKLFLWNILTKLSIF